MTDNKYQNGKIYTIRNKNDETLIYIGSTVQPLHKRYYEHKQNAYNEKCKDYKMLLYQKIRETNNINDWYIELYENFPCNNKEQLNKREGEIIREIGTLNKNVAGRTSKEYREAKKDKLKEKAKIYREPIKEKKKEYYETNKGTIKDKVKDYYEANKGTIKDKAKDYYEANKGTIKDKAKDYYEANKDKAKEYYKQYYKNKKEKTL
jgi:gas vesicle protein